ncbi:M4 family metallopeptidase [Brachybacterium sp.]|uniref:M4 family metallopeptidase n=1 Tax=Brachybacterium sp. TaxID=1891286 RepID=UPI002ED53318
MDTGRDPRHTRSRGGPCGIIPPHLLQQIARAEASPQADAAARTLAVGHRVARAREVRAERTSRTGIPGQVTGLIPPHLQQRLRGPAPASESLRGEAAQVAQAASVQRSIHDAQQGTELPGVLVRQEGQGPSGDESVDEAYDGLGATWELYHQAFSRDSLDDAGMGLIATVHYGQDFQNAFWDGEQMIFGDGDGVYFQSFTNAVDVIGHELTHGVVQFTAGLIYLAQPGALHESIADCFGAMVKQRLLGQSADEADWLIGAGLFTDRVQGVALRSMKAPGTAYDDPVLGKDPQPASMDEYADLPHDEQNDNGGVHINSGIPNRAFQLAATGIGGASWEGAGPLWYEALTRPDLTKDADFATFAAATLEAAATRHGEGSAQQESVAAAWRTVGVLGDGVTATG